MSNTKSLVERRYEAVMQIKQGAILNHVCKRYGIDHTTLKHLILRYDRDGVAGLQEKRVSYYPERVKLAALEEYETKDLSLAEICEKYDISRGAFRRWLKLYEAYKRGDKFALNGGKAMHKCDIPGYEQYGNTIKQKAMPESKEKQERRKALSRLSKKDLQELLLDREAELDILKNLEALVRERENKRHAILRELSKD